MGAARVGERKFVTKYRDPSLPSNMVSLSEEPRPIAISLGQARDEAKEAAFLARQRKYLKEKEDRQNKIKQRIKNIDNLESDKYGAVVNKWPSAVVGSVHDSVPDRCPFREPSLKKEKKNFRDMFTKVKVFDFGDVKNKDKAGEDEGPASPLEPETRNGGMLPEGGPTKGSYVSEDIQARYLMDIKDGGLSTGGD